MHCSKELFSATHVLNINTSSGECQQESLTLSDKFTYMLLSHKFKAFAGTGKGMSFTNLELSKQLGVSLATVNRSVKKLKGLGILETSLENIPKSTPTSPQKGYVKKGRKITLYTDIVDLESSDGYVLVSETMNTYDKREVNAEAVYDNR